MIILNQRLAGENKRIVNSTLTLPFELRKKCRFRAVLDDGQEITLMLDRGKTLQEGDVLGSDCGLAIRVCAASEPLSMATTCDPLLLLRACYHLGNRHTQLQIGEHGLSYLRDHVLDEMIIHLGLDIKHETQPFQPELGAYHHG
ncbi:Urease accessory protein UreE [hydrothermal vent metagenome]|uniref:Urease accessory protein UreE n=1 Tax=hydrothermal vent metagenome TaxID=652676 RepID=A0A3B0YRU2_9ZZZZ